MSSADRRAHARVAVPISARLVLGRSEVDHSVRDISRRGIFLYTRHPPVPVGGVVTLKLAITPGIRPLTVSGRVVRIVADRSAGDRRPLGVAVHFLYGGPAPTAGTPWLQPKDRYTGRCENSNGANVLMVRPTEGSQDLNPSPTADWGLHLADANLPLPALIADVRAQIKAWLTVRLRARP